LADEEKSREEVGQGQEEEPGEEKGGQEKEIGRVLRGPL
jgi:hypothetical protein